MHVRRRLAGVLVAGLIGLGAVPVAPAAPVLAAGELGAGGEIHLTAPATIFDTRPGSSVNDVAPAGAKPTVPDPIPVYEIQVLGQGGVPDSYADVLGVWVTVTVDQPTQIGNVRLFPSGGTIPPTAVIAYTAGRRVSNTALVRPGQNGKVSIALQSNYPGSTHVVVDVHGWVSSTSYATRGARLVPVGPSRIADTRNGTNVPQAPLGAGQVLTVQARGADGANPAVPDVVPNSADVVGVLVNVALINYLATAQETSLSVTAEAPSGIPAVKDVHAAAGRVRSTTVLVPIGADGNIRITNVAGATAVSVDVVGYLQVNSDVNTRAGRVVPLGQSFRAFDTRQPQWGAVRIGPGQAEDWSFAAFANSVTIDGVAVGAQTAVIGNLSTTALVRQYPTVAIPSGYVTLYRPDIARPLSATLNNLEEGPVSNLVIARYGPSATVRVYNSQGYIHYVFDALAVLLVD